MNKIIALATLVLVSACNTTPRQWLGSPPDFVRNVATTVDEPAGYTVAATRGYVWETTIAISPANPSVAVAAGMYLRGRPKGLTKVVETFWSEDAGATWSYAAPLSMNTGSFTYSHQGDPVVAFDRTGVAYLTTLVGYPRVGAYDRSGILLWKSTDGGRTWSAPLPVVERTKNFFDDKEWIGVDTTGGPNDGTIYISWLRALSNTGGGPVELMFTRSRDGGHTWTPEKKIGVGGGPQFAIGPNGEVHITYAEGLTMKSITSRDGGETFETPVAIEQLRGPGGKVPHTEFLLYPFASSTADRSFGPHRGHLYTTWAGSANAYPEGGKALPGTIWFARSTDGGRSWSAPVAVSNRASGRDAMFPSLACDPMTGHVVIAWLDRSDDPENKVARIYATRSTDGGQTFSTPRAFTAPVGLSGATFMGHYNGTAAERGVWLTAFSNAAGKMSVARLSFDPPPQSGPRRRAVRH